LINPSKLSKLLVKCLNNWDNKLRKSCIKIYQFSFSRNGRLEISPFYGKDYTMPSLQVLKFTLCTFHSVVLKEFLDNIISFYFEIVKVRKIYFSFSYLRYKISGENPFRAWPMVLLLNTIILKIIIIPLSKYDHQRMEMGAHDHIPSLSIIRLYT
jgi:hypothetical protein